jgi:hypothetical protein
MGLQAKRVEAPSSDKYVCPQCGPAPEGELEHSRRAHTVEGFLASNQCPTCGRTANCRCRKEAKRQREALSEERLRNTRAWADARLGQLSGAEVIVGAIDELLERRSQDETTKPLDDVECSNCGEPKSKHAGAARVCPDAAIADIYRFVPRSQVKTPARRPEDQFTQGDPHPCSVTTSAPNKQCPYCGLWSAADELRLCCPEAIRHSSGTRSAPRCAVMPWCTRTDPHEHETVGPSAESY